MPPITKFSKFILELIDDRKRFLEFTSENTILFTQSIETVRKTGDIFRVKARCGQQGFHGLILRRYEAHYLRLSVLLSIFDGNLRCYRLVLRRIIFAIWLLSDGRYYRTNVIACYSRR